MESLTTSPASSGSAPVATAVQYSLPGYNVQSCICACVCSDSIVFTNMPFVFCRLMEQIVTRQEVWKYRKVFDGYERDWLKVPFKKLDIGILSEKV